MLASTVAATLGVSLISAAPAAAAPIPSGDAVYVIQDSNDDGVSALYTVTENGTATLVGPMSDSYGVWGASFDATTGLAYFFDDYEAPCTLYSLDIATAQEALVGTTGVNNCDGIDVDSTGVLRILSGDGEIVTVDKATAATISSVTTTGIGSEASFLAVTSTGAFYSGDYVTTVFSLDTSTWVATATGSVPYVEAADLDSADRLWSLGNGSDCSTGLSSFDPADPDATVEFQGDILIDGDVCVSAYAIFVAKSPAPAPAPEPAPAALPATGSAENIVAGGIAALALLALGLASILVATTRRESSRG